MPIGFRFFHGGPERARGDLLIAGEGDVADLDLGAFLDVEIDLDAGGRDELDILPHRGELVAVLAFELLDDRDGLRDMSLIELRLPA